MTEMAERLEPGPVPDDAQLVALRVRVTRRGIGARHGPRANSAQDTLGTMHSLPGQARRTLTRTWSLQFRDGHGLAPDLPALRRRRGQDSAAGVSRLAPSGFSDDHLWLGPRDVRPTFARPAIWGLTWTSALRGADGDAGTIRAGNMQRAVRVHARQSRARTGLPRAGFAGLGRHAQRRTTGRARRRASGARCSSAGPSLDLADLSRHLGRSDDAAAVRRPPPGEWRPA